MAQLLKLVDFSNEQIGNVPIRNILLASAAVPVIVGIVHKLSAYQKRKKLRRHRHEYANQMRLETEHWSERCKNKISIDRATELTSLSFEELVSQLHEGQLLCAEVLSAYQFVAASKNASLNFITQPIKEAEETARRLDALEPEVRKALPLFGVPLSVKECFQLDGYIVTIGSSNLLSNRVNSTSSLVQALKEAGAVPFIRTNLPQTMMSLAAHNPIFGQTRHPQRLRRSPGGSSAGEGAAIGAGASMLGIGSDIGGSVRVPAAWCGICALKPTAGRYTGLYQTTAMKGQTGVRGTAGLMARDVDAMVAGLRATSSDTQFNIDVSIPRMQFNEKDYSSTKPLTIGYIYDFPPVAATESAKRAVTEAVAELMSQGHKVVEWKVPEYEELPYDLVLQAYFGDGGAQMLESLKNDDVSYVVKPMMYGLGLPLWFKRVLSSLFRCLRPTGWFKKFVVGFCGMENVDKWFRLQIKINPFTDTWAAKKSRENG